MGDQIATENQAGEVKLSEVIILHLSCLIICREEHMVEVGNDIRLRHESVHRFAEDPIRRSL